VPKRVNKRTKFIPSFKGRKHTEETKALMSFMRSGGKSLEQRKKDRKEQTKKRREKAAIGGKCGLHCYEKLPCVRCRKRRKNRISLGICAQCSRKAVQGKTRCQSCLLTLRLFSIPKEAREEAKTAANNFKGSCDACGDSTNKRTKSWCLDHDHFTNKFRGILCFSCNIILGHVEDNMKKLESLISYLRAKS